MPKNRLKPHAITATHLPQGFIHSDLKAENLIFDSDTHKVKAIIDFEFAHYDTFAHDLAMTISQTFMSYAVTKKGVDFTFNDAQAMQFMKLYCKERPLTMKEPAAIDKDIIERLETDLKYWNKKDNVSLSEERLQSEMTRISGLIHEKFRSQDYATTQPSQARPKDNSRT